MKLDPRRALQVTRYHTWPRVREQSVGEHSAQVMRILLAIWPAAPRHLLVHCLVHDVGEVQAGDPPYPSKKMSPEMGAAHARIERDAHLSMVIPWGLPSPQALGEEDHSIFKLAEFIEMMEWALHELSLGNRCAELVRSRCEDAYVGLLQCVPTDVRDRAINYVRRREAVHEETMK